MRAVTMLIDFGDCEAKDHVDAIDTLAELANKPKLPRLVIMAAAREPIDVDGAHAYAVGCEPDEAPGVVVGRARYLDEAEPGTSFGRVGPAADHSGAYFPFEADALGLISELSRSGSYHLAAASQLARAVLLEWQAGSNASLIRATDLPGFDGVRDAIERNLSESGVAAMRIAMSAAQGLHPNSREMAARIVGFVVLRRACGSTAGAEVDALIATVRDYPLDANGGGRETLVRVIKELAASSQGTLLFDAANRTLCFNPDAANAQRISSFNTALQLLRRFDATLMPVQDARGLQNSIEGLRLAMAAALEAAIRNREVLSLAGQQFGASLRSEQLRSFDDYIALAEAGADALIDADATIENQIARDRKLSEYDTLEALEIAVPCDA
ncbi:MAG TPA: hypothetical protein VMT61_13655 [Candidatus Binataceae bacterium]|nr:hypothetical protein [Candidatus Binataceae bacterium]